MRKIIGVVVLLVVAVLPLNVQADRSVCWVFTTDDQFSPFNLDLAEVFRAHGAKYTAFIMLATVGNADKLTLSDIRSLHESRTVEIASHGNQHGFPMMSKEAFSIGLKNSGGAEPFQLLHHSEDHSLEIRFGRDLWTCDDSLTVRDFASQLATMFPKLKLRLYDAETAGMPVFELETGNLLLTSRPAIWSFRKGWPESQMRAILADSKTQLERMIGASVTSYAFPFGSSCVTSRRLASEYYRQARVTDPGSSRIELSSQPTLYKTRWNEDSWLTRGQNGHDRWAIPVSIDIRQQLYDLSAQLRAGRISKGEMRSVVREIVSETQGQDVVISDHNGAIDLSVYDAILCVLKKSGIPVKTFGEYASKRK